MKTYILRRLLNAIPIVFGVMLILFVLFHIVGGDPSYEMAGKGASPETIAEIRHEYGFDKPLFINVKAARTRGVVGLFDTQLVQYLWDCVTFDFGKSFRTRQDISEIIRGGIIPSLSVTVPMLLEQSRTLSR